MLMMAYNVWQTVRAGRVVNDAPIPQASTPDRRPNMISHENIEKNLGC
jgi:hypothetical protein